MSPAEQLPAVVPSETLSGGAGCVDLWTLAVHLDQPQVVREGWEGLLAPEERARRERFRFERDRRSFAASRVLLRTALSRYADVAPSDWRFEADAHGRPSVASPRVSPVLHFSLSHTEGLVACAVSAAHSAIGVDVEPLDRGRDDLPIAERYFSGSEVAALRALAGPERRERFLACWTLKESYAKARGLGLALPLDGTAFALDAAGEVRARFGAELRDDPGRWRFALLAVGPRHLVAVAADTGGAALTLRSSRLGVP